MSNFNSTNETNDDDQHRDGEEYNNNDDYYDTKIKNDRSERIVDDNNDTITIQNNNNYDNCQQCFTSIQQRRFWLPVCDISISLCPSMDLISFGTYTASTSKTATSTIPTSSLLLSNTTDDTINNDNNTAKYPSSTRSVTLDDIDGSTTIHLHRTVNWQKLAVIQVPTVATTTSTTTSLSATATATAGILQYKHVVWRPDGRYIAIADTTNRISLLSVEGMLNQNNHGSIGGFSMDNPYSSNDEYEIDIPGKVYSFSIIAQPQDNINPIMKNNNQTTLTSAVTTITGLSWVHIGKRHPAWSSSSSRGQHDDQQQSKIDYYNQFIGDDDIIDDEDIADIMWEYRSYFVDREKHVLPRSYYHTRSHLITSDDNNNTSSISSLPAIESSMNIIHSASSPLPDSETPLSLLFVVSTTTNTTIKLENEIKANDDTASTAAILDHGMNGERYHQTTSQLHAYLYGRYPIALNLDLGDSDNRYHCFSNKAIATSADLSHILIANCNKMSLNDHNHHHHASSDNNNNYQYITLYTIPAIVQNQYTFQQIGTLYSKITTHIQTIKSNISIILSSFLSSLKPLDMKLDALQKLLQRYGLLYDTTKKENDNGDEHNDDDDDLSQGGKTKTDADSTESIRSLLVRYILSGYTRTMPNLSNAMDQFFTSAAMNDQLVLRMERSLSAAISNVEKSYKQTIIAPMIALHYSITSLHGLAQYRHDIFHTNSSTSSSYTMIQKLITMIEILNMTIEMTLQEIIQTRFRLRDFIAWLRSTAAQVKARGTSMKSVQRDNAKKRRITDIVMKRMLSYLQQSEQQSAMNHPIVEDDEDVKKPERGMTSSSQDEKEKTYSHPLGITENILGLKLSSILSKELTSVDITNHGIIDHDNNNSNEDKQHPLTLPMNSSTTKIGGDDKNVTTTIEDGRKATTFLPTIPYVLEKVIQTTEDVFEYPRKFVNKSIQRFLLRFPKYNSDKHSDHDRLAITTRIGKGGISRVSYYGEAKPEGFFVPKVITSLDISSLPPSGVANIKEDKVHVPPSSEAFRQWSIVAHVHHRNQIKLHAFPLQWTATVDSVDDEDESDENSFEEDENEKHLKMIQRTLAAPFQWTSILSFPQDCLILDVSFYGDDGKSSLALTASSSATTSGGYNTENTGKEGRQALCVLVACQEKNEDGINVPSSKLMLWLVDYDSISYSCEAIVIDNRTNEKDDNQNNRDVVLSFCDSTKNNDSDNCGSLFVNVTPMLPSEIINDALREKESESGHTSIIAKVRHLSLSNILYEGQYKLVTSGSRGIGVVFVTENGTTSMELCDLEEHEEVENDEEDDDEDDDGVNQNATINIDEEEEKDDDVMTRTEIDNDMDAE